MLVGIIAIIVIALLVVCFVLFLTMSAIAFSRGVFALLVAFVLEQNFDFVLVPNDEFLNYVAWALLVFGLVYLLSTLPRVKVALQFFSTILISVLTIDFVIMIGGGIFSIGKDGGFVFSMGLEIIIKLICVGMACLGLLLDVEQGSYDLSTNGIMTIFDRGLASVMYGFSVLFLFVSLVGNWEVNGFFLLIVFVLSVVLTYVGDIYFVRKGIFSIPKHIRIIMPR